MSSSRDNDQLETQNDQRLDDLHSKIRTLRGVTTDIYDDVERQNLTLDETGSSFDSFGSSLRQSSQRAIRAFGLQGVGVRQWRIILYVVLFVIGTWITWHIIGWWWGGSPEDTPL